MEAQSRAVAPEATLDVPSVCESLRTKVLQACEHFWGELLGGSLLLKDNSPEQRAEVASSLPSRCQRAFTAVWETSGSDYLDYALKFLLLAPLLGKALGEGFLAYPAQVFWSGFSHRLGTRVLVDKIAALVGGEDVEFMGRPLGALLRSGVWTMDGGRAVSSGLCHAGHFLGESHFWTWVSEFYGSLKGDEPSTFMLVNYNETKLKASFLWNYETRGMANVCIFEKPSPAWVVIDLQNGCGTAVNDLFIHLQDLCNKARRQVGAWKDDVDLGLECASKGAGCPARFACACKGCAQPAYLAPKTEKMWLAATQAIAILSPILPRA